MTKDPVCGMTVDDKAALLTEYAGQNYRFCSPGCKTKFDREPARYAAAVRGKAQYEGQR